MSMMPSIALTIIAMMFGGIVEEMRAGFFRFSQYPKSGEF